MPIFFNLYSDTLLQLFTQVSLNEVFDIISYLSILLIEEHVKHYIDTNANNHFFL